MTKSEIKEASVTHLGMNQIYVRTLNANGSPSTSQARHTDWDRLMDICLDNREADIGKFIRRHIGPVITGSGNTINPLLAALIGKEIPASNGLKEFLEVSFSRYTDVFEEKKLKDSIPDHGSMEVAVIINGSTKKFQSNQAFLNRLMASNPQYTGWPVWSDSRGCVKEARPYINHGYWEAMIAEYSGQCTDTMDFWRISPEGKFYLYRALPDDIGSGSKLPENERVMDFGLVIRKVTECVLVAIAFAKAMDAAPDAQLEIMFRWRGLKGRTLSSWADFKRHLNSPRPAYQDEISSETSIPIDTATGVVHEYVYPIISELFAVFDGFSIGKDIVEDLAIRLSERRS